MNYGTPWGYSPYKLLHIPFSDCIYNFQVSQKKNIYKAPVPYSYLSLCPSGGMFMIITPFKGLIQKHCLGLQICFKTSPFIMSQGGNREQLRLGKVSVGYKWAVGGNSVGDIE